MGLHQASGRWQLGLGLTLATALFWATLPIALKVALEILDPITLTWFRFVVAAAVTAAWLGLRGGLRGYGGLARRHWGMLGEPPGSCCWATTCSTCSASSTPRRPTRSC